jgi:hypothetical protein
MLLAAAAPFALALGGMGAWGVAQKTKADRLAAAVAHQETELQRLALAVAEQARPQPQAPAVAVAPQGATSKAHPAQGLLLGQTAPKSKPKELVIQVERSPNPNLGDQQVKAH